MRAGGRPLDIGQIDRVRAARKPAQRAAAVTSGAASPSRTAIAVCTRPSGGSIRRTSPPRANLSSSAAVSTTTSQGSPAKFFHRGADRESWRDLDAVAGGEFLLKRFDQALRGAAR
jgi:hypothetical protein